MFGFNFGVCGATGGAASWPTWNGSKDGSAVQFEAGVITATTLNDSCVMSADVTLVVYRYNSILKAVVVSTSGKVVTGNSATTVVSSNITGIAVCAIDSTRAMLVYRDTTAGKLQSVVLSISGTTVSVGTVSTIDSTANSVPPIAVVKLTTDQCVAAYRLNTVGCQAVCLSTSSTTITVRTPFKFTTNSSPNFLALATLSSTTVYAAYERSNSDDFGMNVVLSISTNTITTPTAESAFNAEASTQATLCSLDSTHVLLAYKAANQVKAITSSISGTTITNGSAIIADTNNATLATQNNAPGLCAIDAATAIFTYSFNSLFYGLVLTISGTTTTPYTPVNLLAGPVGNTANRCNTLLSSTRVLSIFSDTDGGGCGTAFVLSIV